MKWYVVFKITSRARQNIFCAQITKYKCMVLVLILRINAIGLLQIWWMETQPWIKIGEQGRYLSTTGA